MRRRTQIETHFISCCLVFDVSSERPFNFSWCRSWIIKEGAVSKARHPFPTDSIVAPHVYPYLFRGGRDSSAAFEAIKEKYCTHPNIILLASYGGISIMCLSPAWNAIRGITITHKNSRRQWYAFPFHAPLATATLFTKSLALREGAKTTDGACFPFNWF